MTTKSRGTRQVVITALAITLGVGVLGLRIVGAQVANRQTSGSPSATAGLSAGFRQVVKQALPAVVNISTTKVVRSSSTAEPLFQDPFFRDFFGEQFQLPKEWRENSLGSGVIVSPDGHILTNNHVIQGATEILVALADRREFKAKVIGADPKTDIALLKVDARDLPFLKPADSAAADVGDIVLAIGNPFGVGQTVTMGIVSAVGRGGLGIEAYEDFIQTDAAINPGNSGGALIDTRGALIGINTAIVSRAGGSQGVGFAIPANMARDVMDQILRTGKVVRGWLGVSIQPVTPPMARAFGLSEARGALISGVAQDSPAARASLATGDVIVELNGRKIMESRDLQLEVGRMRPGAEASLKIIRDGKERSLSVKLGEAPEEREVLPTESRKTGVLQGLEVDELTPQVARQLRLSGELRGVVVVKVDPGSAAAAKGIQRGDVVQQANRQVVTDVRGFEAAVRRAGDGTVLLLLNRQGRTFFVVLETN